MENLVNLIKEALKPEPINSDKFAEQQMIKANNKVKELSEKVYLHYLCKGEEVANEKKQNYLNNNLLESFTQFK